jgi:DNA-binding FrmR family transcriptional regulator
MNPLPEYLPSNLTAEETLRALEPCLPPLILGHIEQLTTDACDEVKWAQEEVEELQKAIKDAEEIQHDAESRCEEILQALSNVDDAWEAVKALIPKTRWERPEVDQFETLLIEALKL